MSFVFKMMNLGVGPGDRLGHARVQGAAGGGARRVSGANTIEDLSISRFASEVTVPRPSSLSLDTGGGSPGWILSFIELRAHSRDAPLARLSLPPAPPPSVTRVQAPTRCGRSHPCPAVPPPSRADPSGPLPASPRASYRSSRRSCCPDRGRAACRCGRPAPSRPASPPSRVRRGSAPPRCPWRRSSGRPSHVAVLSERNHLSLHVPARPHAEHHADGRHHREMHAVTSRPHHHLARRRLVVDLLHVHRRHRPALRQRDISMRPTEQQRHPKQPHLVHQTQPALKLAPMHPPTHAPARYTLPPTAAPPPPRVTASPALPAAAPPPMTVPLGAAMHLMLNLVFVRPRQSRSLAVGRNPATWSSVSSVMPSRARRGHRWRRGAHCDDWRPADTL